MLLVLMTGCLIASGCANLPDSSAPQALGTIDRAPTSAGPPPPTLGRDPDLLLRDFLQATADPTGNHQTARQYLTPDAASAWDDHADTVIVEKPDTLRESRTADAATYVVRAHKIGQLAPDGSYHAADGTVETRIDMAKVGSEWRIAVLEPGVVIERTAFAKSYRRYTLYFPNLAGTTVVPDLRWVAAPKEQLAGRLVAMLQQGPPPALAPAVRNMLAPPISLKGTVTKANGDPTEVGVGLGGIQLDFTGASTLDPHSKELLAAEVVLTLAGAEVLGPYLLLADGKPLDERYAVTGWSVSDVNSLSSATGEHSRVGLHALRDGGLVSVDDNGSITPAPGYFGSSHNLQSVALSQDGQLVAAVADSGRPAPEPAHTLLVGSYDGTFFPVAQGNTITRPSWTFDGGSAWAVIDGEHVIRAVHDHTTGNVSVQDVDATAIVDAPQVGSVQASRAPITELRVSHSGARAALIAGGRVYIAVVVVRPDGTYALTAPEPVAVGLSTNAVSLDWITADTIILTREGSVDPVQTYSIDGSDWTVEPSQNLTPPLRVVSATPDVQYVADSRAVLQLQSSEPSSDRFWREVPGLTGPSVSPVLPG
ncbi:MtrAB system accessory lipoprotein LpqB [Nocardia stercoris]|uniref:Lipoprotein LpqB n=1 Tax=Nocardia stercoris TaxID=2483361 RepID=A0A3M2LDZ3_9NOCA|nr:MtrAB system accessory protein LpqB [Nocardia stercoris]